MVSNTEAAESEITSWAGELASELVTSNVAPAASSVPVPDSAAKLTVPVPPVASMMPLSVIDAEPDPKVVDPVMSTRPPRVAL